MSEYINFTICSPERFQALQRVFEELKRDKDADDWRTNEKLLTFFDAESLNYFYWPPEDERRQRLEDLQTRPILITPADQVAGQQWDFDSLIEAFVNGEYNLLSCEMLDDHNARLSFFSLAYPYGGVGCMVGLIEAFDGVVTGVDDGTGYRDLPITPCDE